MTAVLLAPVPGGAAASSPVRVLVVDDSAVIRGLITRAVERDPALRVVGSAMHGEAALAWLERNMGPAGAGADVIVLDVEMPVMDGLTTLGHIQDRYPRLPVVMASSLTFDGAATTVAALARGAAGCVRKPVATSAAAAIDGLAAELVSLLKAVTNSRTRPPSTGSTSFRRESRPGTTASPQVVVVGASTGGPRALSTVLTDLGKDFPLPVLVVQHMPPLFTPLLARHLQADSGRPTKEAAQGETVEPGCSYVAPGGFHLEVERRGGRLIAALNQARQEHFCRPSVNPLFRSAARTYGPAVVAVMLTGMGEDGIEGSREVVESGGRLIAQDEATSVVWGMPAAVARAGLAEQVLPLTEIGPVVRRLCGMESTPR